MDVVLNIEGRDAIPVRALPWLTDWEFGATEVAEALAHCKDKKKTYETFSNVQAWRLNGDSLKAVKDREWRNLFTAGLDQLVDRGLSADRWQAEATRLLPASAFVWLEEWVPAYEGSPDGTRALALLLDEGESTDAEDAEDLASRTLDFDPHVPPELASLVMEGFDGHRLQPGRLAAVVRAEAALAARVEDKSQEEPHHKRWRRTRTTYTPRAAQASQARKRPPRGQQTSTPTRIPKISTAQPNTDPQIGHLPEITGHVRRNAQPPDDVTHDSRPGLKTSEVIHVFKGLRWDVKQWSDALNKNRPGWLMKHWLRKGTIGHRGKQAEWCPLGIAESLLKGEGRAKAVDIRALDQAFNMSKELKPWRDEWKAGRLDLAVLAGQGAGQQE